MRRQPRGLWEVVVPDGRGGITCESFDDARRIAYLAVAHAQDCELIVRDGYDRVLQREVIAGRRPQSGGSPPSPLPG